MEQKDSTFYPLIILFFVLGIVIGYVIHQPETQIKYINNTIEVQRIVEPIATVTPSPTSTATAQQPEPTALPDFVVKIYDQVKDKPNQVIEIINWKAMPESISLRMGDTVLIKVVDYPDQPEPRFIMDSYERKLGTAGMIIIKFNKIGTYEFKAIIPNDDPSILPTTYAKGSIKVY